MGAYVLRRLLATIPVMVVVAVFVFFLLRLAPGDPAAIIAGEDATAEAIAAVRAKLGLDRPVIEQFALWLYGLAQGDLGVSIFSNLPVTRLNLCTKWSTSRGRSSSRSRSGGSTMGNTFNR